MRVSEVMSLVDKFLIFAAVVAAWYNFWTLAGSIFIIVFVWSLIRSNKEFKTEQQKDRSEKEQRRERFEKEVKRLQSKVNKGLNRLLDEEMGIFSSAYRSSVSTNSFGKKDYSKFIKEME